MLKLKCEWLTRLTLLALISLLAACGEGLQPKNSGVAIVDLDAVAKALGYDESIKLQMQIAAGELSNQLTDIAENLETQLREKQEELGESEEGVEQLNQMTLQARQQYAQTQNLARQKAQQYQASLIVQLRQLIEPVVGDIAKEAGASSVMMANSGLVWFDTSVDITGEVIDELRARNIKFNVTDDLGTSTQDAAAGSAEDAEVSTD